MKSGFRAALILVGTALLYLGLLVQTPRPWFPVLLVLLTAVLLFAAGWKMAAPSNALASGVSSVVLFLLNPAVVHLGVRPGRSDSPLSVFFAMAFLVAWLWVDHWSMFMRAVVLTQVFALGLWAGAPSTFWILLAMIPWVVFNRRPLAALGLLACVGFGGWILYGIGWIILCLALRHGSAVVQPLKDLLEQLSTWVANGDMAIAGAEVSLASHWINHLLWMSLPWFLLSLWAAGECFWTMIRDRRSDISSVAAALVAVLFLVSLYEVALGYPVRISLLASWVAFSAPLVTREGVQRELLFTRSARITGGMALALGILIILIFRSRAVLWGPVIGAAAAFFLSTGFSPTRRLVADVRGRAVLLGATIASYVGVYGFFGR